MPLKVELNGTMHIDRLGKMMADMVQVLDQDKPTDNEQVVFAGVFFALVCLGLGLDPNTQQGNFSELAKAVVKEANRREKEPCPCPICRNKTRPLRGIFKDVIH